MPKPLEGQLMVITNASIIRGLNQAEKEQLAEQAKKALDNMGKDLAPHIENIRAAAALAGAKLTVKLETSEEPRMASNILEKTWTKLGRFALNGMWGFIDALLRFTFWPKGLTGEVRRGAAGHQDQ
jgi:hypothetical protein